MNSLSLCCFKSKNFHISNKRNRNAIEMSFCVKFLHFLIFRIQDMPYLVIFACRKKDKRSIYTVKLSAAQRASWRWEAPSPWSSFSLYCYVLFQVKLELWPIMLCFWWARLRISSGDCNITPICPDCGKGSSDHTTGQVWPRFPLCTPWLKRSLHPVWLWARVAQMADKTRVSQAHGNSLTWQWK